MEEDTDMLSLIFINYK